MAIDTPSKQQAMRKHIDAVVAQKKKEIDRIYDKEKQAYLGKHFSKRRNEIHGELDTVLEKARQIEEEWDAAKKRLGYDHYGYVSLPSIDDGSVRQAVENEFGKAMQTRKDAVEDQLEVARLEAVEKVLFADEQELKKEVEKIKQMKMQL